MTKSLIALLTLVAASPLAAQDFKRFDFMVGCWEGITGKDQVVQECWTSLADNMMLGMARYLTKRKAPISAGRFAADTGLSGMWCSVCGSRTRTVRSRRRDLGS